MASQEIANELERFKADIDTYDQSFQVIRNTYKEMFDQIKALDAMWTGTAHDAFMVQFGNDAERMEEIIKFAGEFLDDLRYAHNEYTRCESSVNDIVNSLRA